MTSMMQPWRAVILAICVVIGQSACAADQTEGEGPDISGILALASDIAAGQKNYMRNCRACHGRNAKGASSYPKLVEQPAEHLITMLARYRSGEKIGPNTPLMAPRAKNLSDQDIANLAAFIVSLGES